MGSSREARNKMKANNNGIMFSFSYHKNLPRYFLAHSFSLHMNTLDIQMYISPNNMFTNTNEEEMKVINYTHVRYV